MSGSGSRKGIHFSQTEKEIIVRVFNGIRKDNPDWTKTICLEKAAEYTGCGMRTVERFLSEEKKTGQLHPPKRPKIESKIKLDDHQKYLIRKTVHSFFFQNKLPSIDAVHAEINKNEEIPKMSRSKLYCILKELNFQYSKRKRKSILIERSDIVSWRRRYLRAIKKVREEGRPIYYLDETWVNAGHTKQKVWQDNTIVNRRQAFNQGLSTGLKNPSGKGKRLIVLHIGSKDGFLEDGLLLFEGIKTGDYHEEMNATRFEEWFQNILNKLPPNSVVVMDNASYHSRLVEKVPNSSWKKQNIQNWLTAKNIDFDSTALKAELLQLVAVHKPVYNKHVVDEMALKKNVTVLRLPPYHCELNPIELIWAFIKNDVAMNNTTFKFSDLKILFQNAVSKVTPFQWHQTVEHVVKEEEKMWQLDNLVEKTVEEIVISVNDDSSATDWSEILGSDSDKEN